jgi:hypothetical protein
MRHRTIAAALLILGGCGRGTETPTAPPPPPIDLRVSCQPPGLGAAQGCATGACSVTGLSGFGGSVSLACVGQPAGVTCTFGRTLTLATDATATTTFLVSADGRVPPQSTFEVAATGAGVRRTTTVTLQATPLPQPSQARDHTFLGCAGYTAGVLQPDAAFLRTFVGAWSDPGLTRFCGQVESAADGSFVMPVSSRCIGEGQPVYLTAGGLATCVTPAFARGTTSHVTLLGRPAGSRCP